MNGVEMCADEKCMATRIPVTPSMLMEGDEALRVLCLLSGICRTHPLLQAWRELQVAESMIPCDGVPVRRAPLVHPSASDSECSALPVLASHHLAVRLLSDGH